MKHPDQLPLLDFFLDLRNKDRLPLGIGDYKRLLQAFQGGFGIDSSASLKRICKALWVKSASEERKFNHRFIKLEPELRRKQESLPSALLPHSEPVLPTPEKSVQPTPDNIVQELPPQLLSTTKPQPDIAESEPAMSPEPMNGELTLGEDETEYPMAVTAVQIETPDDKTLPENISDHFILTGDYFPVTRRQIKYKWRYLRCLVREGNATQVDVEATVNEVGKQGILLDPVMLPRRINRAELLLLIDQNGSMVPFHLFTQQLQKTAVRGRRFGKIDVYYFHNVPSEWLYKDTVLIKADRADDVYVRLHRRYTHLIIISDAGAARSGFSSERLRHTQSFLKKLKRHVSRMVWLNPMPRFRWIGTTADEIAQAIPMFDMSPQGMDNAISALRRRAVLSKAPKGVMK
ncbi:hypothetical protein QUF75_09355 [Desulfococcaceae bacterium HSG7]|nr:hypothetical protein [Desulfococcaceae bacterium HSG7]